MAAESASGAAPAPTLELLAEHACFGGRQRFYRYHSPAIGLTMRFGAFVPDHDAGARLPALFCLAGLTCTEETFMMKAGAQRVAASEGLILITPDTSPRGAGVEGETASWELGVGAGFYVDATEPPWRERYRMYSHILELRDLVVAQLGVDDARVGITGHSMGGHGALVLGLRNPDRFRSISAFAPIAAPSTCPWGERAFGAYLGPARANWRAWDATALIEDGARHAGPILVDQGLSDTFLERQLHPEALEAACLSAGQELSLRRHPGYDHGYFFISTFVEDHLRFHRARLG